MDAEAYRDHPVWGKEPLLSGKHLAAYFGVTTKRTLRYWRARWGLPSTEVKGIRRYPLYAVVEWAASWSPGRQE